MPSTDEIQRARRVLGSVRRVRIDAIEGVDVMDRFGLLTVTAGVRDVAAFGFVNKKNEGQLSRLKGILNGHGLLSLITHQISPLSNKYSNDVTGELAEVFDRVDANYHSRDTGRLLWVFRDPKKQDEVEKAVAREIHAGVLLGYPPCCVDRDSICQLRYQHAFAEAIISAVGRDASAVERALREDLQVEVPADTFCDPNIVNTRERFPFVFHTACDECLSSDRSQSAGLNCSYEALALTIDRTSHRLFSEISRVEVAVGRIIEDAEKRGLEPDELEPQVNQQLRELFEERDRIYARFFET
jgi:hypothetical protein